MKPCYLPLTFPAQKGIFYSLTDCSTHPGCELQIHMPQSSLHFFSGMQVWVQNTAFPPTHTGRAAVCGHRCM